MPRLSFWITPILAGTVWLATLLALLLYWSVSADQVHYSSMAGAQRIPYISDIGAATLKPLFITGCVLTTVLLDLSLGADRWLRHKGCLAPNTTTGEKALSGLTIVFALVGTAGAILLSVFDRARYRSLHRVFLLLFIGGYVLSAVFICWEYQRLGMRRPPLLLQPVVSTNTRAKATANTASSASPSGSSSSLSSSRFSWPWALWPARPPNTLTPPHCWSGPSLSSFPPTSFPSSSTCTRPPLRWCRRRGGRAGVGMAEPSRPRRYDGGGRRK
jgi:hypothetical protein